MRMKMPESQGVPLLSNLESQFRFTIMIGCACTCMYVCARVCMYVRACKCIGYMR